MEEKIKKMRVLLIGNGPMADEYAKTLNGLGWSFVVSGRNLDEIQSFQNKHKAESHILLEDLVASDLTEFQFIALVIARDVLQEVLIDLVKKGARNILVEKPLSLSVFSANELNHFLKDHTTNIRVALNRRHYQSVRALKSILKTQKPHGALFDFTELSHVVSKEGYSKEVFETWAFGNSIHVFDTVRFLLGEMSDIDGYIHGKKTLSWHPNGCDFYGRMKCGDTPVSYLASWSCPGRWNIEIMTEAGRYKLSPMEKLQVQLPGTFVFKEVELDYNIDLKFKPGLYEMLLDFAGACEGKVSSSPTPSENAKIIEAISKVVGYSQ